MCRKTSKNACFTACCYLFPTRGGKNSQKQPFRGIRIFVRLCLFFRQKIPRNPQDILVLFRATIVHTSTRGLPTMSDSQLPKTRKGAQRSGSNKYKTGKPCSVAGHIAPRYTDSGTCCECISAAGVKARYGSQENKDIAIKLREARQAVIDELIGIRLRCYMEDLDRLRAIVVEGTRGRFPVLGREDIIPKRAAGANEAGTALFWFNVAAADVEMFRSIANSLLNARGPDLARIKAKMLAAMLQAEDMNACPVPPFVP